MFSTKQLVVLWAVFVNCPITIGDGAETQTDDAQSTEPNSTTDSQHLEKTGLLAKYRHTTGDALPGSVVTRFTLSFGPTETIKNRTYQWHRLQAEKANSERYTVWALTDGYPAPTLATAHHTTARYILQLGDSEPLEFRNRTTDRAVLPTTGGWRHLFPRTEAIPFRHDVPENVQLLGHPYQLMEVAGAGMTGMPPAARTLDLQSNVLIGFPHNTRQKDDTRRFDQSDYEYVRLAKDDITEMVAAGINCVRVDAEQSEWISDLNVFHWGPGGQDVSFPECLYQSNYLGPALFLDEPAVVTRDHVVRPKLREDAMLRRTLTPQLVLADFRAHFKKAKYQGAPRQLLQGLAGRADVDLGSMDFLQANVYSWETMVSTAIHQLSEGSDGPPAALVFEPPGRFGTRRTLPEMNMTYGCQIPTGNPQHLIDMIYGFLRGAARVTRKDWGMSIYGAVDRADAFWFQTHAYDLGATHFFFWDTYQLACVPYRECLALSRNLSAHAASHPDRDLEKLKRAAEVAILLPPGYNLGHVDMGKGSLWGLGELNLERVNQSGVKYRTVMSNFFTEIERCIRLGIAYDLFWNIKDLEYPGYREIVRVREDGKVDVETDGHTRRHDGPRKPLRPAGAPPRLSVQLSANVGKAPLSVTATADVSEGSAAVYYTLGTNARGRYDNVMVAWELFGPADEDYRFLRAEGWKARIRRDVSHSTVEINFQVEQPGNYRLRAATVDMAGRTDVAWTSLTIE